MKINSKIQLQRKFNTISGVQANSLLRFKSDGSLEAVSQNYQGLLPQIKVIASPTATVTCKKGTTVISLSAKYPSNSYYFNVPGTGTYSITINNQTPAYNIVVSEYKQYVYNTL